MKRFSIIAILALGLGLVYSCQSSFDLNEDVPSESVQPSGPHTYTCRIADLDSKVSVDAAGKTAWEDGDVIVIHGHKFDQNLEVTLHNFSNGNKNASFTADLSGIRGVSDHVGEYYVSYPASAYVGLSGSDTGYNGYYSGFSDTNHPLMAGYLDTEKNEFVFYNLCGVLTFKVSGDYNGYIFEGNRAETVAYDAYRVKLTSTTEDFNSWKTEGPKASVTGTVNGDGETLNYIYFPNGASFPNGFTLYLMKDGIIKGYVTSSKAISVDRGHQKNMGVLPEGKIHARAMTLSAASAIDLNNTGGAKQDPANSYLLVRNSTYRDKIFKIWAVKGNDLSQPLDDIASVEVLWESRCESTGNTTPGFIVSAVDFDKNHIYFQTPANDDFKDGNAVIAAKNSEGDIIWSWHIWVSYNAVTDIPSSVISTTKVMDRNLGALRAATTDAESNVTSYGLLYQWGRKDPFLGGRGVSSGSLPGYVSAASREFSISTDKITLDGSIQNPMCYGWKSYKEDWCTTSAAYWGSTKTIYDPCPSGYKVMKKDSSTELWGDGKKGALNTVTGWNYYSDYHSFTFGDSGADPSGIVVFPMAGYKDGNTTTTYVNVRAGVWSTSYSDNNTAYLLNIRPSDGYYKRESTGKARGYSVRCVVE